VKHFHLDKRFFSNRELKWVSFESHPKLGKTKKDIYGRCLPCISNLYEQLKEKKEMVNLGRAYHCWKVVAVVESQDECLALLTEFEEAFLGDRLIKGRFGSGDETKKTKVIVMNADSEEDRDRLFEELRACADKANLKASVTFHRGCVELYHEIFGDWKRWKETSSVENQAAIDIVLKRIRQVLYWDEKAPL
jgi:hypothetical protein